MKLKIALATLAGLALAAALLLPSTGAAKGGGTTVKVGDDFFSPSSKSISSGTNVKFKWVGTSNDHNVTKTSGPGKDFASETTASPGVQYERTFKKSGTYKMVCTIHPDTMQLKLKVN